MKSAEKPDSESKDTPGIDRREFLRRTGTTLAAASVAGLARQYTYADGSSEVVDPACAKENWNEPWVWRPSDWPGQQLHLNVIENESPGGAVGFGNDSRILFSYNGATPGPTVRMRGDETLRLKLRNLLGEDLGSTPVGPSPDLADLPPALATAVNQRAAECQASTGCPDPAYGSYQGQPPIIPADVREDWCLGEHTNGVHSTHVTNFHTHGLHVRPGTNPDGTQSDNVILRVLSQADYQRREGADDPLCRFLRDNEQSGEANYEFRIGDVQKNQRLRASESDGTLYEPQSHPAGTHWYHPHSHGATHNQVSSGMAGFLIVEGPEDDAINRLMTGSTQPNLELKSKDWDYRERLMLIQRVLNTAKDPDGATASLRSPSSVVVNGNPEPTIITMRPGAVERWRILNGSVDGRGFKRFMVVRGQYRVEQVPDGDSGKDAAQLQKYDVDLTDWRAASLADVEADKQPLYQLSMDGVTLMKAVEGGWRLQVKDLSVQNAGSVNPLATPFPEGVNPNRAMLDNFEACFRVDGASSGLRDCWVRPNEVYLAPANRADVFFQAPEEGVYTVLAKSVIVHADNYQSGLQARVAADNTALNPFPQDIITAYISVASVAGEPVPPFDMKTLDETIAGISVPEYLLPPTEDELQIGEEEAEKHNENAGPGQEVQPGQFRTRRSVYSGWGAADSPLFQVPDSYVEEHPELKNLTYASHNGTNVLLSPNLRTMAINGRKFSPSDPERPFIMADGAEEWALFNSSLMCWTDKSDQPDYRFNGHYDVRSLPTRAEAQARFRENSKYQITTKAVDHPFHIHTNPFWVVRIDIPDENGTLHNILEEPRWQDVIWIPRNGGRVIFRQRYPDYLGLLVNHCHLLLHEDNGMMTGVTVTEFAEETNYSGTDSLVEWGDSSATVDILHRAPSLSESFLASAQFVDPNHNTGQVFPGFALVAPPEEGGEGQSGAVRLSIERIDSAQLRLSWDARKGETYTVQTAAGGTPIVWEDLDSIAADADGPMIRELASEESHRLFRLLVSQP